MEVEEFEKDNDVELVTVALTLSSKHLKKFASGSLSL